NMMVGPLKWPRNRRSPAAAKADATHRPRPMFAPVHASTRIESKVHMALSKEEIAREVSRLARWHYQFDLAGVLTPIHAKEWINRHEQRQRYFFDPLVRAGVFKGK